MNTESMGTGIPGGPNAPGGNKVPIYELAKELGISNKDLVTKIRALGIEAKNHMSRLDSEDASRVRRAIDKERQENTVQEHLTDTVIRRRSKDGSMLRQPPPPPPKPVEPPRPTPPPAPTVFVRKRTDAGAQAQQAPAQAAAPAEPRVRTTPPAASVEARPATRPEPRPEARPEPRAEARPEPRPEVRPEPRPEVRPEPRAEARPEPRPDTAKKPVEAPAPAAPPTEAPPRKVARPETPPPPQVVAVEPPVVEAAPPKTPPSEPVEAPPPPRVEQQAPAVVEAPPVVMEAAVTPPPEAPPVVAPPVVVTPAVAAEPAPRPATSRQPQKTHAPAAPREGRAEARSQEPRSSAAPRPSAAPAAPRTEAPVAPAQQERVFVTAQTRRQNEGLGPTGRVIDLSALRTSKPPPPPAEPPRPSFPPAQPRGPREEVTGERLRQPPRQMQQTRPQPKTRIQPGKKPKTTQITTAAEHKRVVKMGESIIINELARQMGLKATDLLKKIWELGMRSVMINSPIDFDTAQLVSNEFDWRVESTAFSEKSVVDEKVDQPEDLLPRAPVITIMGHVDHGKTSLLDAIRNANVAAGEAGGITQHIGAYKVHSNAGDVVFLDTPGHEAFTEMRARGAQATDIVVLVVAADDGVMPQTLEALNHAKDANVPIIVAVNKIDKPGAQPDRIRQQLSAHNLTPEEWGGETIYCDVSARTKVGVDRLLEMLALQSEVLELKANPNKPAKGVVIEARMDAKRGPVATILVQEGHLRIGDNIVVGEEMGKVRAMNDDKGAQQASAGPSTPVEVLGLSGVPRAGEVVNAVSDERAAKELVEFRRQRRVEKDRAKAGPMSLDKIMAATKDGLKELKIILKADVQGSVEALSGSLVKLSTGQVKVTIIQAGVGGITETDVNLAKAGNAVIIGFHVRPAGKASSLAEQEGVEIRLYDIIYEALDDVKKAMAGLLAPVKREKLLGKAEIRQVFTIPKVGAVAGCGVTEGLLRRNGQIRLVRDSVQIYQGKLASLRRFKDDVREVQQGYECGLGIEGYNDIKVGDVIECFEIEEIAATLS